MWLCLVDLWQIQDICCQTQGVYDARSGEQSGLKTVLSLNMTPCSLVEMYRCFGETRLFNLVQTEDFFQTLSVWQTTRCHTQKNCTNYRQHQNNRIWRMCLCLLQNSALIFEISAENASTTKLIVKEIKCTFSIFVH